MDRKRERGARARTNARTATQPRRRGHIEHRRKCAQTHAHEPLPTRTSPCPRARAPAHAHEP
eukprot:3317740-Pleurochrysis_carterae.AAC.1